MFRSRTLLMSATLGAMAMFNSASCPAAQNAQAAAPKFSAISAVALHKALQTRADFRAAAQRGTAKGSGRAGSSGTAQPAEIYANPNRAYPPSCLNDGLPFGQYQQDPNARQIQVSLPVYDPNTQAYDLSETDTFTVWRVPCSGGTSAALLEIDRPSSSNGNVTQYPIFPDLSVTQAGSSTVAYPRLPQDPNTVYSDTELTSPIVYSSVYVFEYYNPSASLSGTSTIDYNQAFMLSINNFSGGNSITLSIPPYDAADFNNFPSASNPMPISGYMSTNWSNPNQSGEGMVLQVYDGGDQATRILSFAWFTYDDNHIPFWLYGQGSFNIGDSSVTVPVVYFSGGSFAGTMPIPGNSPYTTWGSATITFPDCNDMTVIYQGDASAVKGPTGNGTIKFRRAGQVNGLTCQ